MSPFNKLENLKTWYTSSKAGQADREHELVCNALGAIMEHIELFDQHVPKYNPFLHELEELASNSARLPASDLTFSLLECLAVIFREKALHSKGLKQSRAEQELLEYFENNPEWSDQSNTLVSTWYWEYLPHQYAANKHCFARNPKLEARSANSLQANLSG